MSNSYAPPLLRCFQPRPGVCTLRTPEACWDISQAYASFAYAWTVSEDRNRTPKGWRGFLAPLPGCDVDLVFFPGVRKKRVPLANIPARLRRAQNVQPHRQPCAKHSCIKDSITSIAWSTAASTLRLNPD